MRHHRQEALLYLFKCRGSTDCSTNCFKEQGSYWPVIGRVCVCSCLTWRLSQRQWINAYGGNSSPEPTNLVFDCKSSRTTSHWSCSFLHVSKEKSLLPMDTWAVSEWQCSSVVTGLCFGLTGFDSLALGLGFILRADPQFSRASCEEATEFESKVEVALIEIPVEMLKIWGCSWVPPTWPGSSPDWRAVQVLQQVQPGVPIW